MRQMYPHLGVGMLCGLFGKTRNAFYDHQRRATAQALLDGLVLDLVAPIRQDLPQVGTRTRKLLHLVHPQLGEYAPRVGRDYLVTERINGILKEEFGPGDTLPKPRPRL